MEATNNPNNYTDEQWEALLCRTFGDPEPVPKAPDPPKPESEKKANPAPAPTAPIVSKPATSKPATPSSSKPTPKKKRKTWKVLSILLAVLLVLAVVAIHIFPREEDSSAGTTKEQRQCMKALRQWQEAQSYQISTTVNYIASEYYGSSIPVNQNSFPYTVSTYYHGDDCRLSWTHTRIDSFSSYEGQAELYGNRYTYASGLLSANLWTSTEEELEISRPWILDFSLEDVQIVDQQVYGKDEKVTVISFAVMDLAPNAAYYNQGPYHVTFIFEDGQLCQVMHYLTDTLNTVLTVRTYTYKELTADLVENLVKLQLDNPTAYPGLSLDSIITPSFKSTPDE